MPGRLLERVRSLLARDQESDGGSVWDLVPSRQYGGRHAEAGGIARDEQESAIEDVAEQAEALDGADRR